MDKELSTFWNILYGEDFDDGPDPNKPENVAYYQAKRKERNDKVRAFMSGQGRILFEEWKKKARKNHAALLVIPEKDLCTCLACQKIRDTKKYIEFLMEAEKIISEQPVK
jgi:hypothetical protein